MRGPWVRCLNLSPTTLHTPPVECTVQIYGIPYINVNASFGRTVLASTSENKLVNSDILWTIPLSRETPGMYTYYTNYALGGKISYNQSILEQIEIYFTDPQNNSVSGLTDWTLILTFDFVEREERSTAMTSKRARRYMV